MLLMPTCELLNLVSTHTSRSIFYPCIPHNSDSMKFQCIEKYLDVPVFFNFHNGELHTFCHPYSKLVLVADENSMQHCYPFINKVFQGKHDITLITISSGEKNKTLHTVDFLIEQMLQAAIPKNSLLLALGGGVLCDLAGFAASIYKRGIPFALIPTTLLAMVDAAIGGKTAVNHHHQKNMIGLIHQPKAIFINEQFLHTLPPIELKNGYAESIKHGLIANRSFFENITLEQAKKIESIHESASIKMNFVAEDEHEQNIRKALNFGHTVGHAFESFSHQQQKPISHGFAVAFGMYCEAYLSMKMNRLIEADFLLIANKLKATFHYHPLREDDIDSLMSLMQNDKKNDQHIRFSLLNGIGAYAINQVIDAHLVKEAILHYIHHYNEV